MNWPIIWIFSSVLAWAFTAVPPQWGTLSPVLVTENSFASSPLSSPSSLWPPPLLSAKPSLLPTTPLVLVVSPPQWLTLSCSGPLSICPELSTLSWPMAIDWSPTPYKFTSKTASRRSFLIKTPPFKEGASLEAYRLVFGPIVML